MRKFKFEEFDAIGEQTLEALGKADNFNRWMYNTIIPWCKGSILEIGSGAGNISKHFLEDQHQITLSDIRQNYCHKLEETFAKETTLQGTLKMDLNDPDFDKNHQSIFNTFDTVFALNVVEHIEHDFKAVANCHKLLKKNGRLIILVPSYQHLYNNFDIELGHYRRYTKTSLSNLFYKNHFDIIHKQYFNFTGMFGWFFSGRILRKKVIPVGQVKVFNMLVPAFKILDKLIFNSMGLSTIVVGKK